jgi:hypothetical protein
VRGPARRVRALTAAWAADTLRRAARAAAGVELSDPVMNVMWRLFDTNGTPIVQFSFVLVGVC